MGTTTFNSSFREILHLCPAWTPTLIGTHTLKAEEERGIKVDRACVEVEGRVGDGCDNIFYIDMKLLKYK